MSDHKSQDGSPSQAGASASTSDRKLSIELPSSRQIYTIGSAVSGLVHLGTKERGAIQEVHASLVCIVRIRCTYQFLTNLTYALNYNMLQHRSSTARRNVRAAQTELCRED